MAGGRKVWQAFVGYQVSNVLLATIARSVREATVVAARASTGERYFGVFPATALFLDLHYLKRSGRCAHINMIGEVSASTAMHAWRAAKVH